MQIRPNWSGILGPMFFLAIALVATAVVTAPGTIPAVSARHTPVAVPSPERTTVRVQTPTAMAQTVGPEGDDPVPTNGTATVQISHLSLFAAASVTDPHGGYSDSTDLCQSCHAVHAASSPSHLLVQPTEKQTCYQCHDGAGASTDIRSAFGEAVIGTSTKTSFHPVPTATDGYELTCTDCHTPHKLRSDVTKLLRVWAGSTWLYSLTGSPVGNAYCYTCHGPGAPYPGLKGWDYSPFDAGAHGLLIAKDPAKAEIQCLECHEPHGSDFNALTIANEEQTCFICHTSAAPNTSGGSNPYDAFTAAANDTTTADGDPIRIYHHPVATADQEGGTRQVECVSCHNPHLADRDDGISTSKLVDPSDVTTKWIVTWDTGSADLTRGDIGSFCEKCHIDPATTTPISAGPTVPYDIRLVDDTSSLDEDGKPHDRFTAADWENTAAHGPSGDGNLACTACHDFHGSSNAYMLKENMVSPGGTRSGNFTGFDALSSASWDNLKTNFCFVCHGGFPMRHSRNPGPCTKCHYHGSDDF
ncbi:doubled CXXCH motif [bacterium BMS3Bbin01]|nr:doubled CXXCH motif [bacterium BMS3Bbin01]